MTLDDIDDINKQKLAYIDFDTVIKENVKNININDPMTINQQIEDGLSYDYNDNAVTHQRIG